MKLYFNGFKHEEGSPVNEALSAVKYATALSDKKPLLLGYTPVARMNPFQGLLYKSFWKEGYALTPISRPLLFEQLIGLKAHVETVALHLHWHSVVLAGAKDRREAKARSASFKERVENFKDQGGKIVWTVHNVLPHDAEFMEEEMDLQSFIADSSDVIHTMSHRTVEAMRGTLNLDTSKILMSPHPSYVGAYEDYVDRHEARATLGIHSDEIVYVILGALKPYKGLDEFIAGFDQYVETAGTHHRLIIAGESDKSEAMSTLVDLCHRHPHILLDERKIPSNLVQYYMRAADYSVVPYVKALNSGAALLGPSFGLPVIASRAGSLPEVLGDSFTEFLPGSGSEEIAAALTKARRLRSPEVSEAALRFSEDLSPDRISTSFAKALKERLQTS